MTAQHTCPAAAVDDGRESVSVADWTAGYEAGWTAGYHAARTALDDAAALLARTLRPVAAVDVAEHRHHASTSPSAWRTPAERDAYRARVYASWGLPAPASRPDSTVTPGEEHAR